MLIDFRTSFTARLGTNLLQNEQYIPHHTLKMLLHYFMKP